MNAILPSTKLHECYLKCVHLEIWHTFMVDIATYRLKNINNKQCLLLSRPLNSQSEFLLFPKTWQKCLIETAPFVTELPATFILTSQSWLVLHPLAWFHTMYFECSLNSLWMFNDSNILTISLTCFLYHDVCSHGVIQTVTLYFSEILTLLSSLFVWISNSEIDHLPSSQRFPK